MDPERRREYLLDVASRYIAAHGTDVSLDEIAREADVSPPLMRHYFKNREGLLATLAERAAADLETIYLGPAGGDLGDRVARYLDWVATQPWVHWLWVASSGGRPAPDFGSTRRRLISAAIATPWDSQDLAQRVRASAWTAIVESSVSRWLEEGEPSRDELVEALLAVAVRLDVVGAKRAARRWRGRLRRQAA
jgi:AcrR family transcriptional regulator